MANLMFKYGSYEGLKNLDITNGQILVTTDEKAMYVDLEGKRIRLGQTVVYSTFENFISEEMPPKHPEAFYYVEADNALFKWVDEGNDKGHWNQINSTADVMDRVEALEETVGGHGTRLTAAEAAIVSLGNADTALGGRIDTLAGNVYTKEEANAAIDAAVLVEKERALAAEGGLATRIDGHDTKFTAVEGNIASLQGKDTELAKAISDEETRAKGEEEKLAQAIATEKSRAEGIEAGLKGRIDGHDNLIATKADITALNKEIQDRTDAVAGVQNQINDIVSGENGLGSKVTALEGKVGNAASGLIKDVADLKAADTVINEEIGNIKTGLAAYATKVYVDGEVKKEKDRAELAEQGLANDISAVRNVVSGADGASGLVADVAGLKSTVGDASNGLVADVASHGNRLTAVEGVAAAAATQTALNAEIKAREDGDKALSDRIDAIVGGDGSIAGKVEALSTEVADIKKDIAENVKGDITALDGDLSTFKATVEATYVTKTDYNAKVEELAGDIADNASDIDALETRAGNIESAATTLAGRVTTAEGTISGHGNRLTAVETKASDNAKAIADLQQADIDLKAYVDNQFSAADAMRFIGGVSSYSELPTDVSKIAAGDTYIVELDFVEGGVSYYAGDLLVAAKDGEVEWTHVTTGYQANQEAKLTGTGNAIKLTSHTNVDLGQIAVEGKGVAAEVANNKLTITLEWGSF